MRSSMINGNAALAPTPERDMLAAGIDIIPDRKNNLAAKRQKRGECPTCGIQTHKVALFGKNKPLTVEGEVYKGRCLICHPLEGYIRRPPPHPSQMAQQHPDAPLVIPRTLEVGVDDEDFSVVSGITMDMRLIQGARNWDPSQGADYDSDDEPPTGLPNRRPEPSVGGDDPYADSRPDPGIRPPRTMPSYTQSLRNMGMRPGAGAQSSRDFVGMHARKHPPHPPAAQAHGRFPSGAQRMMGKSEASLSTGMRRQPRDYMRDGHMDRMDQKPAFQPRGYNEPPQHPDDPYNYPDEHANEEEQNYKMPAGAGYSAGSAPGLDADGYPVANSNFGWKKEDDILPPGGMDSIFNRKPSKNPNQLRASIASANNEIEFNPAQKAAASMPTEDSKPPLRDATTQHREGGDDLKLPQRISSLESGPMYQSDDFPTYVDDNDMPGPVPAPRLISQTSGPMFYASETTDEGRFQMETGPPALQSSKTTGPDVFSRFQNGRTQTQPPERPKIGPRIDSQHTSESSFAPPLINRNLRGRPDDDMIQDPMSDVPTSMGIASMTGRGPEAPKASASPYRQEAPALGRPAYGDSLPAMGNRQDPYQYNRHSPIQESGPYDDDPHEVPSLGDYQRSHMHQRQDRQPMPYGQQNGVSGGMDEMSNTGYGMSEIADDGPAFDDDMSDRDNFEYNARPPADPGPPRDYGRAGYGVDDRNNNLSYGMMAPPGAGSAGDHAEEARIKAGYGAGIDGSMNEDHGMASMGSLDYDRSIASAASHGGGRRMETKNQRGGAVAPAAASFENGDRQVLPSSRGDFNDNPYASSGAVGSDEARNMLGKLSVSEPEPQQPPKVEEPKPKTGKKKSKDKKDGSIHDIPAILHCLNLEEANSNLREKALVSLSEILWKSGEKARSFIVEHKGIETLVKAMWSDIADSKIQAAALAFLFSLSASPDARASGDMLANEESICDTLLFSMQTHAADPGIQLHGCAILACLASASSNNVKISDGSLSGALRMVVNAMGYHSRSREIQKAGLQALYCQCLLSTNAESNKRTLMEDRLDSGGQGIDAVLSAMRTIQDDLVAMEWACKLCWCLTSSQDLVKSLASTSVTDVITGLCQRYMPDQEASGLIEAAFGVIANLSYLENKRSELESVGIVPCLVDGIRYHPNDCGVSIEACSALANLGVSPLVRDSIIESGAIGGILQAIQTFGDSEDLMTEASRAIVCLTIDSPDSKERAASPDVLKAIVQANRKHEEAQQLHEMSCSLFASLAVNDSCADLLVESGVVDTIIQSLKATRDEKVRDAACLAYRNLACALRESDQILQKGAISSIVQAMSKYEKSVSIQMNACCSFWNLAYKTDREPGTIVGSDGIKCIVKAMQSHLESGELLELACGALWSLVDDSVERKKDVVGNGAIDAVACAVVMHPGRVSTLEKAFGVLSNVSLERPLAEAIVGAQGVNILVEAMRNNTSSISMLEVGCTALRNLIFQFPEYAPEASSVVSAIINSMKEHPDAVTFQQEACNLLWILAAEAENCQSKILALDGVAVVMKCMEMQEVQESALGAFRQLASGSNMAMPR